MIPVRAKVSRLDPGQGPPPLEIPLTPEEGKLFRRGIRAIPTPMDVSVSHLDGRGYYSIEAGDLSFMVDGSFGVSGGYKITRNQTEISLLCRRLVETYENRTGHQPWAERVYPFKDGGRFKESWIKP